MNPNGQPDSALTTALTLAQYRVPCFPCWPRSKEPATAHGFKDATTDLPTLVNMFNNNGMNVAAAMTDMCFVMDLDGGAGLDWLGANGRLPVTWSVVTGKGRHFWFTAPTPIRSRKVAEQVETRGVGGYVMVPPSVHPSGSTYCWDPGPEEWPAGPAEVPSWLLELVLPAPRQHKPRGRLSEDQSLPGSAFNQVEGAIEEILTECSWEFVREDSEGRRAWRHPAATNSLSANVLPANGEAPELLHVFSSNAGFPEVNATYNAHAVMAYLQFAGDFSAAARELARRGYGQPKPGHFFEDSFIPKRMADQLNSESRIVLGEDSRLYRYVGGVYRPDGWGYAGRRTKELLAESFRARHWREVEVWFKTDLPAIGTEADKDWLNLANGRLNWRTGELSPHSPDHMDTIRIPHKWIPGARCPKIEQFLAEVLPEDSIEFVLELIGYTLIPDSRFQKAVMLLGPTGTGKGTLLRVLERLIGWRNFSAASLHELVEDRFSKADLYGKLGNILDDLDARAVERSDTFKMITGQGTVRAQFKYGQPFMFVPFAKLWFSANEAPPTADQSDAYFGRWLIVPMTRQFRDTDEENTALRDELTQPGELEGLLQLCVPALRRLWQRGKFDIPASVKNENEWMRYRLDTLVAFTEECCEFDLDAWCSRVKLYRAYHGWCRENGRQPVGSGTFYERFETQYSVVGTKRDGYPGYGGIRCFYQHPDLKAQEQVKRIEKFLSAAFFEYPKEVREELDRQSELESEKSDS